MVDLALPAKDALALLEAKVIKGQYEEIHPNFPYVPVKLMESSLPRALDQAVNSASRLPEDLCRSEVYLECVPFKQLLVTDGVTLHKLVAGTAHGAWSFMMRFAASCATDTMLSHNKG